jgi:hypothetical protein
MNFPIHDWQFWIATLAAAASVWFLLRPLIPSKRKRRTSLTVEGKSIGK